MKVQHQVHLPLIAVVVSLIILAVAFSAQAHSLADNPNPPASPVRLVFVHHSTGGNWLADPSSDQPYGGLGRALMDNNYYVSATNYGWGPENIGDRTDIPNWPEWFTGPNSAAILAALYSEGGQNFGEFGAWPRPATAPGGENQIVMFKSCFPNSDLYGNPNDPPLPEPDDQLTVANAKAIYNRLLTYFATRQDKLFVVITAPPLMPSETAPERAANARAVNNWLVNNWLAGYPYQNVAVFDYYNVLTSSGGGVDANDLGWPAGNHHRWWNGAIQHSQTVNSNTSAYPSGDSHPTTAGHQKAAGEFVPLLNVFYHRWQASQSAATPTATSTGGVTPPLPTPTRTPTATRSTTSTWTATAIAGASASPTRTASPTNTQYPIPDTPTPTVTPPSGQQTMIFQDGVAPGVAYAGTTDTIVANDFPDLNLGGGENLETFWGEAERRRSLLRWDLAALPANAAVQSATVELYRYEGDAPDAMPIALYRVTRGWVEGTGADLYPPPGYVADGATWRLAGPAAAWTTPGGDFDAAVVGQITLPAGMTNGWIRLDATAAVRAWAEGGQPNYGLLLRPFGGQYTYHYYRSRNYGTASLRPRLVVTYTVGGAATPTPSATPGASATPSFPYRLWLPLILKLEI